MSDFQTPAPLGESELEALPPHKGRVTTFASLKNRHYRWFWLGMLASFIGRQVWGCRGEGDAGIVAMPPVDVKRRWRHP